MYAKRCEAGLQVPEANYSNICVTDLSISITLALFSLIFIFKCGLGLADAILRWEHRMALVNDYHSCAGDLRLVTRIDLATRLSTPSIAISVTKVM